MKENVFEVFTTSLDGNITSFSCHVRLDEEEAIVKNGQLIEITPKGWARLGAHTPYEQSYYKVYLMTLQDRMNKIAELNYRISLLEEEKEYIVLSAEETSLLEEQPS